MRNREQMIDDAIHALERQLYYEGGESRRRVQYAINRLREATKLCRICGEHPTFEDGVCRWEACEAAAQAFEKVQG